MNHSSARRNVFLATIALFLAGYSGISFGASEPLYDFAPIAQKAMPAVVGIEVFATGVPKNRQPDARDMLPKDSPLRKLFPENDSEEGAKDEMTIISTGSGFIFSPDGKVQTNAHVILKAEKIEVIFNDGRRLPAKILGGDTENDLAILQIEGTEKFPFLRFGDSDSLRVGNPLVVIGNPFGLGNSLSTGVVSAVHRITRMGPIGYIQTDAAINVGNSGGPILNFSGEVVGIVRFIISPGGGNNIGIGFGIPSNSALVINDEILSHGYVRHAWLGAWLDEHKAGPETGVLITWVRDGSPAKEGGLLVGDVILSWGGKRISSKEQFTSIFVLSKVGSVVKAVVLRNGSRVELSVKIREAPDSLEIN